MRILYISGAQGADYLCDLLFHGLRWHFGPEVVDVNRLSYLYRGAETSSLYGKGFTLYGLIDEGSIDRIDIPAKIKARYFDYVIFGSIQREYKMLGEVRNSYGPEKILLIDGEDNPLILRNVLEHGIYFKREMHSPQDKVWPIQFAIPEEKLQTANRKSHFMAALDPMDARTYIYDDEAAYYGDYRSSLFAKTMKKAGWDCLRHYEILACQCLPYFQNIEFCPPTIMQDFPKEECRFINSLLEYKGLNIFHQASGQELWADVMQRCDKVLREKLTTKALATKVLDIARSVS